MKYLCEGCDRIVELERFEHTGGAIAATCGKCGAVTRSHQASAASVAMGAGAPPATSIVAIREPGAIGPSAMLSGSNVVALRSVPTPLPPSGNSFAFAPEGYCPKCVSPRKEGTPACAQCGLIYENFLSESIQLSPDLEASWRRLVDVWSNPEEHDKAMRGAMQTGELADLGRLYRIHLGKYPKDAMALRGRDEVVRLALLPSTSMAAASGSAELAQGRNERRRNTILVGVLVLCLIGTYLLVMKYMSLQ